MPLPDAGGGKKKVWLYLVGTCAMATAASMARVERTRCVGVAKNCLRVRQHESSAHEREAKSASECAWGCTATTQYILEPETHITGVRSVFIDTLLAGVHVARDVSGRLLGVERHVLARVDGHEGV